MLGKKFPLCEKERDNVRHSAGKCTRQKKIDMMCVYEQVRFYFTLTLMDAPIQSKVFPYLIQY